MKVVLLWSAIVSIICDHYKPSENRAKCPEANFKITCNLIILRKSLITLIYFFSVDTDINISMI